MIPPVKNYHLEAVHDAAAYLACTTAMSYDDALKKIKDSPACGGADMVRFSAMQTTALTLELDVMKAQYKRLKLLCFALALLSLVSLSLLILN